MGGWTYSSVWTYTAVFTEALPEGSQTVVSVTSTAIAYGPDPNSEFTALATVTYKTQSTVISTMLDAVVSSQKATPDSSTTQSPSSSVSSAGKSETRAALSQATTVPSSTSHDTASPGMESTTALDQPTGLPISTITITAPSVPSPEPSVSTPNISSGVLAGVGIACAAVGAILASFVLCFLVFRRRTTRAQRSPSHGRPAREKLQISYASLPKWPIMRKDTTRGRSAMLAIEASLPPPLQDSEISGALLRLGTSITNHAHGHFNSPETTKIVDLNQDYLAQLLGQDAPISVEELTHLLLDAKTRTAAVRFLLGWCILQHIQSGGDPCRSLLPPEIAESLESMAMDVHHNERHATMLPVWRQMTGFLMSSTYNTTEVSPNDPRQRNINDLTDALNTVLAPLASRAHYDIRKQDLEVLVVRGAHYGWQLFSQPTAWIFDWENGSAGGRDGEIVVLPALLQIGDDQGRLHTVARAFTEAQNVKLGT